MNDLISVIIPTYNVEKYIEQAINSILCQTYKNLELIIVDDFSTDQTYTILQNLSSKDKRIRLFRNEENKKIAYTLNFAIQQSKGTYLVRMDGDDIAHEEKIEKQYKYLKEHPDIALVGTYHYLMNEDGEIIKASKQLQSFKYMRYLLPYSSPVVHIWMTTPEVYKTIGEYRMPGAEDYDFLLRMTSAGLKYANVPEYLYNVRIRLNNTISTLGLVQVKIRHYAYALFKERKQTNTDKDTYTPERFQKAIYVSSDEKLKYGNFAQGYSDFLCQKNSLKKIVALFKVMFSHPIYFMQYIMPRIYIRIIYSLYGNK